MDMEKRFDKIDRVLDSIHQKVEQNLERGVGNEKDISWLKRFTIINISSILGVAGYIIKNALGD